MGTEKVVVKAKHKGNFLSFESSKKDPERPWMGGPASEYPVTGLLVGLETQSLLGFGDFERRIEGVDDPADIIWDLEGQSEHIKALFKGKPQLVRWTRRGPERLEARWGRASLELSRDHKAPGGAHYVGVYRAGGAVLRFFGKTWEETHDRLQGGEMEGGARFPSGVLGDISEIVAQMPVPEEVEGSSPPETTPADTPAQPQPEMLSLVHEQISKEQLSELRRLYSEHMVGSGPLTPIVPLPVEIPKVSQTAWGRAVSFTSEESVDAEGLYSMADTAPKDHCAEPSTAPESIKPKVRRLPTKVPASAVEPYRPQLMPGYRTARERAEVEAAEQHAEEAASERCWYGWFSPSRAKEWGTVIYRGADGREVEVTEVTSRPEPFIKRPDVRPVGQVGRFVRQGRPKPDSENLPMMTVDILTGRFTESKTPRPKGACANPECIEFAHPKGNGLCGDCAQSLDDTNRHIVRLGQGASDSQPDHSPREWLKTSRSEGLRVPIRQRVLTAEMRREADMAHIQALVWGERRRR